MPLRLVVLEGQDRGREVVVQQGTATVGSQEGCELILSDPTVSRRHLSIELRGARLRVSDLGSRNGTRYHGARVDAADLPYGAVLTAGKTVLGLLPVGLAAGKLSDRTELLGLLGRGAPMRRLFAEIEQVAPTEAPVFIHGETGTGKEGVAKALHALSPRATGPFKVFDCGAVQKELLAAALFGHVRGAFTGAVRDAPGALEAADGGVLFLDEVAELPLELQPNFLRALETQRFSRVGETRERQVSFRIVSATHRNLAGYLKKGLFRADLFHRLVVVALEVPPLRERPEDIPLLAEHFARARKTPLELKPEAIASLCAYRWPGNVRELRNAVERAQALGSEHALPQPRRSSEAPGYQAARERVLRTFTRAYLEAQLERHRGSVARAAKEAGLARTYYYKLLEEHAVKPRGR
ncbi:MAG: sigma 54-interacting transcriptional regulator [Myxococcaceae bacterium]